MDTVNTLRRYGLFDVKVPRYTSYPPANRFVAGAGAKHQQAWMADLPADQPVSIYVHIPFCRRLCWFCACRTQGTQTLAPVDSYVADVIKEIDAAHSILPRTLPMARLHLGGGTPTLLSARVMDQLLGHIHDRFPRTADFELSVEIDPTEAEPDVLKTLATWNMRRASIGVQDFASQVQDAIGRHQSFAQTKEVIDILRDGGVESLNIDMLYGLPYQTGASLVDTLDRVLSLRPDRIALYGYAHVPHVSKRQVMIPSEALPSAERRFIVSRIAQDRLTALGYQVCGIDHFARPSDSLAIAARTGKMRRNFQGYTDDPCETLIGFGASAISKYPAGYTQNAVATAAYRERVQSQGLAAHRGFVWTPKEALISTLVEGLMCEGRTPDTLSPQDLAEVGPSLAAVADRFPLAATFDGTALCLRPGMEAAARLIAAQIDQDIESTHIHSLAI